MAPHSKFRYRQPAAFLDAVQSLGLDLRWQEDLSPLSQPVRIGAKTTPNALAVQPMEGCDGTPDGAPGELTYRRYERFAAGGAGLLWLEATAVVPEGRANPRQLWLHRGTAAAFADLAARTYRAAGAARPVTILQLTHSGRYSRPVDRPAPIVAYHLPSDNPEVRIITDDELAELEERYVEAAVLAGEAGFDGVDIKHCHRYLLNELLSARTRPGSYGGSYENRTRFICNVVTKIRRRAPSLLVGVRLNAYDGMDYPYGWGVPDLSEPIALVKTLRDLGVAIINVTAGNPYATPHINRPYDEPIIGGYVPGEHPLEGVHRLIHLARELQQAAPDLPMVGTGYSWLRNQFPHVAAANIAGGWIAIAGVGREAFSYPDFARDLLTTGRMDPRKTCITCSKCSQLMRDHTVSGCVPHDSDLYLPIYSQARGH